MAYTSVWVYGDYDLDDMDTRLGEILLSAELTAWNAAADQTKDILLLRAVEKLESLAFRGEKYEEDQTDQFPRVDDQGSYYYDEDAAEYEVPQAIYDAIGLEAVAILARQSDKTIEDLQERGVKMVQISGTGVQYEFIGNAAGSRGGFYSDRAWKLVERYLARDVCVI